MGEKTYALSHLIRPAPKPNHKDRHTTPAAEKKENECKCCHLQHEVVGRSASTRHAEQEVLLEAVVSLAADAAGPGDAGHSGPAAIPRVDSRRHPGRQRGRQRLRLRDGASLADLYTTRHLNRNMHTQAQARHRRIQVAFAVASEASTSPSSRCRRAITRIRFNDLTVRCKRQVMTYLQAQLFQPQKKKAG